MIATSWSDNARKGAETLAWLDAHLDRERYELTFVGRARRELESVRTVGPVVVRRGRAAAPRARRLSRAQPRRSVLERAPRGARVRAAGRLPRERRAPRARGRRAGSGFVSDEEIPGVLDRLVAELDERRGAISVPTISAVADRYLEVLGLRRLESRGRGELPQARTDRCALPRRPEARPRVGRARARRSLRVGRLDEGHVARRAGAQEPARPLDLPGDHGRDATRADRRDRDVPRGQRALPRVAVRPARSGRGRLDRRRAPARGLPAASAHHVPRRPLLDRSRRRRGGSRAGSGSQHARHPRLRPLAGARRGRARGVRAARAGRLLPHRRGLEHRPDPQGPPAGPVRGHRDLPRGLRRVRDRPRAREVPHHVQPERLPAPGTQPSCSRPCGRRRSSSRRRRAPVRPSARARGWPRCLGRAPRRRARFRAA